MNNLFHGFITVIAILSAFLIGWLLGVYNQVAIDQQLASQNIKLEAIYVELQTWKPVAVNKISLEELMEETRKEIEAKKLKEKFNPASHDDESLPG